MNEIEKTRAWIVKLNAESGAAMEFLETEDEAAVVRQFVETVLKPAFLHLADDEPVYTRPDDYTARQEELETGCL